MSSHQVASTVTPPVKTPPSGIDQLTIGRCGGFLIGAVVPDLTVPVRVVVTVVVAVVLVVLPLGVTVRSTVVPLGMPFGVPEARGVPVPVVEVPLVVVV